MQGKHVLFVALVVWLVLSFMPALLLTNLTGMGRSRASK